MDGMEKYTERVNPGSERQMSRVLYYLWIHSPDFHSRQPGSLCLSYFYYFPVSKIR